MQANAVHDLEEIGVRTPVALPVARLGPGEVGYLIAGIKDVGGARSGETVTTATHGATEALDGYRDPKPPWSSAASTRHRRRRVAWTSRRARQAQG